MTRNDGPVVAGQPFAKRLMYALRWTPYGCDLTRKDVAAVLRALADFTAIKTAMDSDPESSPAINVCRWLHVTADQLINEKATP